MSAPLRVRTGAETAARPSLSLVPRAGRGLAPAVALAGIYLAAFAYTWLQSRAHATPAVFPDETLYSQLARSIAEGHGFTIRGEAVFFPAPLAVLAQAPAWLIQATPSAYAAAKLVNAAIMAAAAFPAYFLARRLVRPSYALLAAAAAVCGPPMVYGAYLMSEALAYPVFLFALATMLRAIAKPSPRMEIAVVAVSLAAVLTRIQFIVVPVAYLVAAPLAARLCGEPVRSALRRHAISLGALLALTALPLVAGGAVLGTYGGAAAGGHDPWSIVGWTGFSAALLPFAAGWLVVPGAILGLALLAVRPRGRADAGFAVLAGGLALLVLLEAGVISAAEGNRPLERYVIYLVPLAAIAFFAYAEHGPRWRRGYAALALAGGATAWLMPFPARAGTGFAFDTPTYSVYGQLADWLGHANAATVFMGVPLLGGIALALVPLHRGRAPLAVGLATIAILFASGVSVYSGDHSMTRGALRLRAADPPDWLDRGGLGPADYLQLPGGSAHFGWLLEAWNRSFRHPVRLGLPGYDGFASSTARIDTQGRLLVDGRPPDARTLVVNDLATAIDITGTVVARPRPGLTAYRLSSAPRVRSLAVGLYHDGWAAAVLRYQAWPGRRSARGLYRVVVTLPRGWNARTVTLTAGGATRRVRVTPGGRTVIRLPVSASPLPVLDVTTDQADLLGGGGPDARLVAMRISAISYIAD